MSTVKSQRPLPPEEKDELLTLLADHHHRVILSYVRSASADVVPVQDLTAEIHSHDPAQSDRLDLRLRHSALPKLDDAGAVDFDPDDGTVRYRGHPELEMVLDTIAEL